MSSQFDSLDRQIIWALQRDGRQSNVEIAREAGVTEATVRKRLDRLLSEGIVRPTAYLNLTRVGLDTGAVIALQVDLTCVEAVAERLADLPEVLAVYHTTGEYDLLVEAAFAGDQDLLRFLTSAIAPMQGIRKSSTLHILRRVKSECQWTLPGPPPSSVLIVDDDPDFVEATRMVLESAGLEVIAAANGDQALTCLQAARPAVIVMDIMMKGILDGLNASWQIQADPKLRDIPILVVSSIADSEYAEMFPTEGSFPADQFLAKPVAPEVLIRETKRLLRRTQDG